MKAFGVLCLCLVVAALTASAQQPSQGSQRFRADVEAVEIDVRVLDDRGQPVRGLSAADFQVFEDGVLQEIRVFTPVEVPFEPRPRTTLSLEPDVRSNRNAFNGRLYVFVLDDLHTHISRTARVRGAIEEFLDQYFAANDWAAIVTTSGRVEAYQNLTSSRSALLAALDGFDGRRMQSSTLSRINQYFLWYKYNEEQRLNDNQQGMVESTDPLEAERAFQARRALTSLRDVARWLETVPVPRKALIYVSEGIEYDLQNLTENRWAGGLLADVREVIARATRSNTNIYAVDPRGLGGRLDETIEISSLPDDTTDLGPGIFSEALRWTQDNLRVLAEESGGFAVLNTNNLAGGFERLVRENSEYYLLGYQPTNEQRDGRFRRIEVRVNRPDMRVLARRGYFAPRGDSSATPAGGGADVRALLDSPLPVPGLTIESGATIFHESPDKASVLVTIEIGPELTFTERDGTHHGRIVLSVIAADMNGRIAASDTPALDLSLEPNVHDAVATHGLRTTRRLEVEPGRYQLRVAVRDDASDNAGTVIHDLRVPDFTDPPLAMSGVLLASLGATRVPTTHIDAALLGVLVVPPTTIREFEQGDTLTVLAELYDNRRNRTRRLSVTTTVADVTGRVGYRSEEALEPSAFDSARRAYLHHLPIPLEDIAPGEYVVRLELEERGASSGSVVREVAFSVRAATPTAAN